MSLDYKAKDALSHVDKASFAKRSVCYMGLNIDYVPGLYINVAKRSAL